MNIIVIGPQHSCTRYTVALIDRHPDVYHVDHMGSNYPNFKNKNFLEKYNKIVIVSRDASCINKSNAKENKIQFSEDIATQAINNINDNLDFILKNKLYDFNNIIFFSIESLVQYRTYIIKKLLLQLELDPQKYDFNLTGRYRPNDAYCKTGRWFDVDLNIVDPNKKYFT